MHQKISNNNKKILPNNGTEEIPIPKEIIHPITVCK